VRPLDQVPGIQAQAGVADALWAVGAALATGGLVLAFALDDEVPAQEAQATAACGPTGCVAGVRGTF
jgi:hypothetical protein